MYVLVDPVTRRPFYVGKGKGDRFRTHGEQALVDDLDGADAGLKAATIRRIRAAGSEPDVLFARIGLESQSEAYLLESMAIDLLSEFTGQLTNLVRGHESDAGLVTLEALERRLSAPELVTSTPAILIKLFNWKDSVDPDTGRLGYGFQEGMTADELLESVRAWWVLDPKRAATYRYVVAVHNGVTRGVWSVAADSWQSWTPRAGRRLRWSFTGSEASGEVVEEFHGRIGRRVPRMRPDGRATFGSSNPIGYWPR